MKAEMIKKLRGFKSDLDSLRKEVRKVSSLTVNRLSIRSRTDALAMQWSNDVSGELKKFNLPEKTVADMDDCMSSLFHLSQQSNRKKSYMRELDFAHGGFNARFIVPIQQYSDEERVSFDFQNLFPNLLDSHEREYMQEAIGCANAGYFRAAVVMGWCAAMSRIHKHIEKIGIKNVNQTFASVPRENLGKFKNLTRNLPVTSISGVQEISDRNLILLLELLNLVDLTQAECLRSNLERRNHSAHPGDTPMGENHLKAFFTDIGKIIFDNPKMKR